MKLYHAPGTCSLAPRIVAHEAGLTLDAEKVDIGKRVTEGNADYTRINPNGYVPALRLDDGTLLTEGVAIVQYLADLAPDSGLAPAAGSMERYRLQAWLTFISSELHKMFSPWLFHPEYGEQAQNVVKGKIAERFAHVDRHLEDHPFLLGTTFTVADAYLFTIARWSDLFAIDLAPFPALAAYLDRVAARPAVQAAMRAEGLEPAA